MKEIPRFTLEEATDIAGMLAEAGILYKKSGVTTSVTTRGGTTEYLLFVDNEHLAQAIEIIRSYYGLIEGGAEPFTGNCPACDVEVENATECPECGLALSADPMQAMADHPFCVFLKQQHLNME